MGIKLEEIEKFAGQFLGFLDANFLGTVYDLHHLSQRRSKFQIDVESFFQIGYKPASSEGGSPYFMSYNIEGRGIPIEIIVDPYAPHCTSFLIKANKTVEGYSVSGIDTKSGNFDMKKTIEGHDFEQVRKELRCLTSVIRSNL